MKIKERRKTYSVCEFFLGSTWLTAQQHSDVITLRYLLAPRASWEMKFILTLLQNKWNAVSFLTTYSNILTVFININVNLYFNSLTYLSVIYSSEIMSVKQINSQQSCMWSCYTACHSAYLSVFTSVSWEMCEPERLSLSSLSYVSPSHFLKSQVWAELDMSATRKSLVRFPSNLTPSQPVSLWRLLVSTGSFSWVNRLTCWLQGVGKLHQVEFNTF